MNQYFNLEQEMDMETSLLDINYLELNESIPQLGSRTQNGSDFRISDTLNEQDETKGDGLDIMEPLDIDKRGWGMLLLCYDEIM